MNRLSGIAASNGIAIAKAFQATGLSEALGDFLAAEIKSRLGSKLRVRADTYGYLQRSFMGCVSPVDAKEARAVGSVAGGDVGLGASVAGAGLGVGLGVGLGQPDGVGTGDWRVELP